MVVGQVCAYMSDDVVLPATAVMNTSTYRDKASTPRCEAGLFASRFACDNTETKRHTIGSTIAWLCEKHSEVITMKPVAEVRGG
jgi:hypothetical protein